MVIPTHRAKPSVQLLRIIKTLITVCALLATLIGATALTNTSASASNTGGSASFPLSVEATANTLIAPILDIFSQSSESNIPCAIGKRKE